MIKIISASADTYITNRIVSRHLRAIDANVGAAGTIDLFKLYNESVIVGETTPIEVSRALIKFDLKSIRALTGSIFDTNDSTFRCTLRMRDIYGGQAAPHNFSLVLHPLSKSFQEGVGRDIVRFEDLDAANFLTASYTGDVANGWAGSGASAEGNAGQENIDIISHVNFGSGLQNVTVVQSFSGEDDLVMDVTQIISGTLAGSIPDCGFRIAFSGSQETDTKTRFVKRFTTRHATSPSKRPQLEVSIDDSVRDNHSNMVFNTTGSLFLRNIERGTLRNFVSGTSATALTGSSCMKLRVVSGTFSASFDVSQARQGINPIAGLYRSDVAINRFTAPLFAHLKTSQSASFSEIWSSNDDTVGFYTGSFDVNLSQAIAYKPQTRSLYARITNCKSEYSYTETPRFILFIEDLDEEVVFTRFPRENNGHVYDRVYYSVKDSVSGETVIPFMHETDATRVSSAQDGMYFDFRMDSLTPGKTYEFTVLIKDIGEDLVLDGVSPRFRVAK